MIATLDLLAQPHSYIPYVQIGLITALQTSNLFSNYRLDFLPISQLISFAFKSVCFRFLAMCSFSSVCGRNVVLGTLQILPVVECLIDAYCGAVVFPRGKSYV